MALRSRSPSTLVMVLAGSGPWDDTSAPDVAPTGSLGEIENSTPGITPSGLQIPGSANGSRRSDH